MSEALLIAKMKLPLHERNLKGLNLINGVFRRLKDSPLGYAKSSQACNIALRPDAERARRSTMMPPQKYPTPFSFKFKSNLLKYMVKRMGDKHPLAKHHWKHWKGQRYAYSSKPWVTAQHTNGAEALLQLMVDHEKWVFPIKHHGSLKAFVNFLLNLHALISSF